MDRRRRTFSEAGAALVGALLIATMAAGGAQAVSISPDVTTITATADNPTFNYGTRVWTCDTSTAIGATGQDSPLLFVDIEFQEPCSIQPVGLDATAECNDGEFTELEATDGTNNQGIVDELHEGFQCQLVAIGVCTLTVGPQDLPLAGGTNDADLLNEGSGGSEAINADVDVTVTNNNNLCGPVPSGTGGLAAVYQLDTAITFDP
jgi:hypothetical protein